MMAGETPGFWWREAGWQARLLAPASALYGAAARWRLDRGERAELPVPVICVGNFTLGGGGKTPTALALAKAARTLGLKPGFLSRGHGGALTHPTLVDPARHGASHAGDEPMLLASAAPTAVAVDRKQGAALLVEAGCDLVIMDDGFQSARLRTDFAVLVVDAGRGLGNGRVMPAGPLRAPMRDQIRHADALLVVGRGEAGTEAVRRTAQGGKPVHEAHLAPKDMARLLGRPLLAFAGIADPEKFYRTLREAGAEVARTRDFPDHHRFSEEEVRELGETARREGLALVTTAKDAVRLDAGPAALKAFRREVEVLEVELVFEPADIGERFVRAAQDAFRRRRFGG